ncbi:hypothetical protein SDC9_141290 [bioreactor metagenome]|uniref:Uncharacterized protein n=1 Tax=bioreactor metagenome TaxID=1076179 RepID=A0A645DXS5_9ZZZZ
MRAGASFRKHGRIGGLHHDNLHIGVLALEVFANTRDRATRASTRNKDVHFAVGIVPNFGAGGRLVNRGVCGVVKLPGNERMRNFRRKLVCSGDCALHALCAFCEHDLRAVGSHEHAALHAHRLRHGQDDAISARCRDGGKPDAGVPAGGLDDHAVCL